MKLIKSCGNIYWRFMNKLGTFVKILSLHFCELILPKEVFCFVLLITWASIVLKKIQIQLRY
jgi:hypothetical protein